MKAPVRIYKIKKYGKTKIIRIRDKWFVYQEKKYQARLRRKRFIQRIKTVLLKFLKKHKKKIVFFFMFIILFSIFWCFFLSDLINDFIFIYLKDKIRFTVIFSLYFLVKCSFLSFICLNLFIYLYYRLLKLSFKSPDNRNSKKIFYFYRLLIYFRLILFICFIFFSWQFFFNGYVVLILKFSGFEFTYLFK